MLKSPIWLNAALLLRTIVSKIREANIAKCNVQPQLEKETQKVAELTSASRNSKKTSLTHLWANLDTQYDPL